MRDFFVMLFVLLAMMASCSSLDDEQASNYIEDFEQMLLSTEGKEQAIARLVGRHEDVVDVAVSISGKIAVVGLNLAEKDFCHTDIIAIKQRTADEVKANFDDINHVAVTTSQDMFQKLANPFEDVACPRGDVDDLFDIPIATP